MGQFSTYEVAYYLLHIFKENELKERDDYLFNVWLHKVWDAIDFTEWKDSIVKKNMKKEQKLTDKEADKNIKKANEILGIKEVKE